jgi:hypothetical protein
MTLQTRIIAACGLLAAAALPVLALGQNAAPKDPTGRAAPPGTAVAPPRGTVDDGGKRPPTDAAGKTAPTGTPVAPSRLSGPNPTPSPPAARP